MKMKLYSWSRQMLAVMLAICMVLSGNLSMVVTAVDTTPVQESQSVSNTVTGLRDYTIPTDQKHAYDPFAQMESEEETEAYRNSVDYEEGTVIFKLTQKKNLFTGVSNETDDNTLASVGIDTSSMTQITSRKVDDGVFTDTYEVTYLADLSGDVWETIDSLAETDGVLAAQPNYLYEQTAIEVPTEISKNPDKDKQWHHGPNHLECDKHWQHLHDEGITAGEGSVVAVIDTGVDYTHPDLAANMWVNSAELNGVAGVDDDGNGYVDDIHGVSTVGSKWDHTGDPMDDHGHGTHVAGIIGMSPNNGEGGVGIAYGAKIMAIKAGQGTGIFSDTDVAEAIRYAVAMGADVINMSFGGTGKSFLVEEALADAFATCVLVAAAGNDGVPTDDAPWEPSWDVFPAGYSYVIGVMATDQNGNLASFSNWDYINNGGSAEYELTAPGVDIYSTLPGGQYAYWDGTSMASPVVAAAAALIRSKYPDKSVYSSRFVMGQLASATNSITSFEDPMKDAHTYAALDIEDSLSKLPVPNITVKSIYLFDSPSIDPANDGDGIIDAGETIEMGIVLRNQWGMAGDVTITASSMNGVLEDTNVEWLVRTISVDDIGTFNEQNNGFVYENDEFVSVSRPIRFKVKEDTINDTNIVIDLSVTASNALDDEDHTVYTAEGSCSFFVQRGKTLSGRIEENMTLTRDNYWIVDNTLYIPKGVTVTVEPGTQIQFWGSDASDPYAALSMAYIEVDGTFLVAGTAEDPVEMFPSAAFSNFGVDIRGITLGEQAAAPGYESYSSKSLVNLSYANIINPRLKISNGDHLNIVQNDRIIMYRIFEAGTVTTPGTTAIITAQNLRDSTLSNVCAEYNQNFKGSFERVCFDHCYFLATSYASNHYNFRFKDCSFLGTEYAEWDKVGTTLNLGNLAYLPDNIEFSEVYTFNGSKYVIMDGNRNIFAQSKEQPDLDTEWWVANSLAEGRGGYLAVPNTQEEQDFLVSLINNIDNVNYAWFGGVVYEGTDKALWVDGTETSPGVTSEYGNYYYGISFSGDLDWIGSPRFSHHYIMEFPESVSDEQILASVSQSEISVAISDSDSKRQAPLNSFTNNAVLNNLLVPDVKTWFSVATLGEAGFVHYAINNYWGTTNPDLIKYQVMDADMYASLADIITTPYLTLESPELETIYPFVTDAYITDMEGNRIDTCGYQQIQVHVTFSRDMDTSVDPMVTYGPAEPYTDYLMNGDWVDARHWVATTKVTPVIDSGVEYIRVKDAVAADDKWLVTGTDEARFAFTISSSGAQSMNLQAVGGEDKVELSWMQDDYDTMAGFNVYRATSQEGPFTKINDRLIPATIRSFTDTNVEAGVEYFYYFTVMGTDLVESKPSNTTSAVPLDNIKPILSHKRVTSANYGEGISFTATATDNIGVDYVRVHYRAVGAETWNTLNLTKLEDNSYYGMLAATQVSRTGLEYYVEASDGVSVVQDGSALYPITVRVDSSIVIYSVTPSTVDIGAGGTVEATLMGVNFTEDMQLKVGGQSVSFTLVNERQLNFTVPECNLGRADISLTVQGKTVTFSNAITFGDSTSRVQVSADGELTAGNEASLPVHVTTSGTLYAVDLQLNLEYGLFESIRFEKNEALSGAQISQTVNGSVVKISMASDTPIPTNAPIGYLVVKPTQNAGNRATTIQMTAAKLNAVSAQTLVDCAITVLPSYSLSGRVVYYQSGAGIQGVLVTLSNGMTTYTDADGNYSFSGITSTQVTVVPSFSGSVNNAITAQDASLVLQAITGEGTALQDMQYTAADVDGDGELTSMDASYILRKAVGAITGNFPGSGAEWVFSQAGITLQLGAGQTTADFTGILLGDVSGNWSAGAGSELD